MTAPTKSRCLRAELTDKMMERPQAEARAHIVEQLGLETLDAVPVQNAVNRLRSDGHIASAARGQYELEAPYFAVRVVTTGAR